MGSSGSEYDDIGTQVFAEQIAMIYRLTPHLLAMSMIGSTLVLLTLWPSAPHALVLGWYARHHHEVRTPRNGVLLGIAELLFATPLSEQQRSLLDTLYRSGQGLLGMINDILDFSKIEAGKLELRKEDFNLQRPARRAGQWIRRHCWQQGCGPLRAYCQQYPKQRAWRCAAPSSGTDQPGRKRDQVY
ncbi:MAG TPA: histidine kinase dimerization/phospho-acceptor domain-containing protein [Accumulibacter sp.]|uniref:histidine kinase n=2 Tax=Candidatus Accumulibacter TaxID=327159 RepID=A0A7D5N9Y4_9PROT|nr:MULTISPECIES: histidine kinase dimerization/phospho-acceptor domain-containing protein [Candidatus Accumulibacter]QLH49050.1 MAG: hypothetical protein HWD57_04095 [Candidatus Accumulibacter cognatus]MBL8402725.1 hypothetical protein [Accumulibacter sp.]MBN8518268.1 hypothetical protein [Accumulibacter sp.]MBO3709398.1 hypothetical protein [Accumulibacter sp.]MCM8579415.1 hypothetical protein [Accumulibacter sp.]